MPDLTPPQLDPAWGVSLIRDDYRREFREHRDKIDGEDSWKLERRQHFDELGIPSRDALRRGDWDEALRLMEELRPEFVATAEGHARRGSVFRRARIVEEPLTPYMQWQLRLLRLCDECGESVRVVAAGMLDGHEVGGPLPELVVLGGRVLFQVRYTDAGVPDGGIRYTDTALVAAWQRYIQHLHEAGEDIRSYVSREVAHLPPPPPV